MSEYKCGWLENNLSAWHKSPPRSNIEALKMIERHTQLCPQCFVLWEAIKIKNPDVIKKVKDGS